MLQYDEKGFQLFHCAVPERAREHLFCIHKLLIAVLIALGFSICQFVTMLDLGIPKTSTCYT